MIYLTGSKSAKVWPLIEDGTIGVLTTPRSRIAITPGIIWAADNGCFSNGYPGDEKWLAWLAKWTDEQRATCLFATAPDIVGGGAESLERSRPFLPMIRALGYRAALVTQDGMTPDMIPWSEVDWLFIGGTDSHKLGVEAELLIAAAHEHGKPVHAARVNSGKRYSRFAHLGCASADGTFLGFAPDHNINRMLGWFARHHAQPSLFD
jgi:hypothetical protein